MFSQALFFVSLNFYCLTDAQGWYFYWHTPMPIKSQNFIRKVHSLVSITFFLVAMVNIILYSTSNMKDGVHVSDTRIPINRYFVTNFIFYLYHLNTKWIIILSTYNNFLFLNEWHDRIFLDALLAYIIYNTISLLPPCFSVFFCRTRQLTRLQHHVTQSHFRLMWRSVSIFFLSN